MPLNTSLLPQVVDAVSEASSMLVKESRRPAGPRGGGGKAEVDVEIEEYVADRLTALLPVRFVGKEMPVRSGDGSPYCWLVGPHNGTWAYLQGYSGAAVSVALLRDGVPVLGVVCAPMSPDRGRDLIAWTEGLPHLLRNGGEVKVDLSRARLKEGAIVFLDHGTGKRPVASGAAVAPARFVSLPSIAYRLARVSAGDGVATVSLGAPGGIDYAAGHALLRGAGGVLLDEAGQEVTYSPDGMSRVRRCFGGAPEVARELAARSWSRSSRKEPSRARVVLSWPRTVDDEALDRAKGCLFGQVIGDNLGGLVEFQDEEVNRPPLPTESATSTDGGHWNILAGQATDDSELALALARTLLETGRYDREAVAAAYGDWYRSDPFDCGRTIGQALSAAADANAGCKAEAASLQAKADSQANGSLMRVSPIGIWARQPEVADRFARRGIQTDPPARSLRGCLRRVRGSDCRGHPFRRSRRNAPDRPGPCPNGRREGFARAGRQGRGTGRLFRLQERLGAARASERVLSLATGRGGRGCAGGDGRQGRRYRHQLCHHGRPPGCCRWIERDPEPVGPAGPGLQAPRSTRCPQPSTHDLLARRPCRDRGGPSDREAPVRRTLPTGLAMPGGCCGPSRSRVPTCSVMPLAGSRLQAGTSSPLQIAGTVPSTGPLYLPGSR